MTFDNTLLTAIKARLDLRVAPVASRPGLARRGGGGV